MTISATQPRTIAIAVPKLDSGGPDRVIYELIVGLPRDRYHPVLVVSESGGRYLARLPQDVRIIDLATLSRYPLWRFARAIDALAPDIVLTTQRMNITAGWARMLQRSRVPLIARQANAIAADFAVLKRSSLFKHRIAERAVRYALRQANGVVAQSRDMAEELSCLAQRGQQLATIGNPVSLSDVDLALTRQRASGVTPLPGCPAFVSVGRFMTQKGYDVLLAAMPAVLAAVPQARLTILGEGELRQQMEAQIASLNIGYAVHLPGQSDRIFAEVASADWFVSSSRYEGFSNAILEAMAVGVPIIGTDCAGATREMVVENQTGLLVSVDNPGALSQAMIRAVAADRERMGAAARELVAERYDRTAIAGAYADFFDTVLAGQ